MEFTEFKGLVQSQFAKMTENLGQLFTVNVDKNELWNLYLDSFPKGTNEIYRERREYDCCCCRHFIKSVGNVVTIKDNTIISLWNFEIDDPTFSLVAKALSRFVKANAVSDVFLTNEKSIGTDFNFEDLSNGEPHKWEHFFVSVPERFVLSRGNSRSIPEVKGENRDIRNVFKRSLSEITTESVETVLELISQNSLYRGEEWKSVLTKFLEYKKAYEKLTDEASRDLFAWEHFSKADNAVGKIRNHSIGTLLVDISNNRELDEAVKAFEAIVAPANYKRPKAIYTKKMLEDAKKTVEELGYMNSLKRRFSTLDDITINNILFSNKDAAKRILASTEDIFEEMSSKLPVNTKKFNRVEEVTIDNFVNNILPTAKSLEVLFEGKHKNNLVSLIAPEVKDSKTMFKWNNNFSWSYTGNITDSNIKENVKSAGGKVDGVLRFSIQWNTGDAHDGNDLDAHCIEPSGFHIYYCNKKNYKTGGQLDVDITDPDINIPAVENITWATREIMPEGTYKFFVNNYANRGGKNGFSAEIEFDGQIYNFEYPKEVKQSENVQVAEVTLKNGEFSIKEILPSEQTSVEIWNVNTNQFVSVSVVMHSPNYWDEQTGIGNKHYFFMLKDCINSENPHAFYNEFLKNELDKHKRVFEALGSKMSVENVDDQLSGLGFSSTLRNDLIVKVVGATERIIKIKF